MSMTAAERERFEQQVLALIAGEMRRFSAALKDEHVHCAVPIQNTLWNIHCQLECTFPVPTAPPPAAESEEEVVERVADAIRLAELKGRDFDDIARAAIAAVKGGGGE